MPSETELTIDLIPEQFRGSSLANGLPRSQWQRCRAWALERSRDRCTICSSEMRLHCHEEWDYDQRPAGHMRMLTGLSILCADCHATKHLFRTFTQDEEAANRLGNRMMILNGWSARQTQRHLDEALATWQARNSVAYVGTDLTWLRDNIGLDAEL
jgi:hypothetical protein